MKAKINRAGVFAFALMVMLACAVTLVLLVEVASEDFVAVATDTGMPDPSSPWVFTSDTTKTWVSGDGDLVWTYNIPKDLFDSIEMLMYQGGEGYNTTGGSIFYTLDPGYYELSWADGVATVILKESYLKTFYNGEAAWIQTYFWDANGNQINAYACLDLTVVILSSGSSSGSGGVTWSKVGDIISNNASGTVQVVIPRGGDTTLPADVLQAAKANNVALAINLPSGLTIFIDPATITDDAQAIDLDVEIQTVSEGATIGNTAIPANSIVIAPSAHGQFGFSMAFSITAAQLESAGLSASDIKIFHIDDNGKVTQAGSVWANPDGSVTVSISHASVYVLLNDVSGLDISLAPQTDASTDIALWLAICLISGVCATTTAAVMLRRRSRQQGN